MNQDPIKTETQPGFSIIIPVYNGEKVLEDTLRSVKNLDYALVEILVVDDASTDRTAQIAASAGARVITLERNAGPATARNRGALSATREILLFTDSDVWVPKNLLRALAERFQNRSIDAVQGTFSEVCPYSNFFSQYKNLYNRFVLNALPDWIDTTFTSVTAVRRAAFHACGGFDENIRTPSVEDRTLGRNLRSNGRRIFLDRALEVIHNKRLSVRGFIRNQFRRSRDLAKLLLRNREEPPLPVSEPEEESGTLRYGTNTMATMARLPVAYMMILFIALSCWDSVFWIAVGLLSLLFLYLAAPFTIELLKKRGPLFALKGLAANFLDALASGLGVLCGVVEYVVFRRRY